MWDWGLFWVVLLGCVFVCGVVLFLGFVICCIGVFVWCFCFLFFLVIGLVFRFVRGLFGVMVCLCCSCW